MKEDKFEGVTRSIEKTMIAAENKKSDMKKDDDSQRKMLLIQQQKTHDKMDDLMRELTTIGV